MSPFKLAIVRYRFTCRAETTIHLPAYAGSTWRGAFGHALRRIACITHESNCENCLLWRSCIYSYIYETPAGNGTLLEKVTTAPHPYVLNPLETSGKHYHAGDTFQVSLTLMGKAIGHLPYLIHSFQQMGKQGIGKHKGGYTLLCVEQEHAIGNGAWEHIYTPGGGLQALPAFIPTIPATMPESVSIQFHTPYRALQDGKLIHVGRFSFKPFITGLIRRISLLHAHHADITLDTDFKALSQQACDIPVLEQDLHWYEWSRYSNRQQSKVQMDGLLGSFRLPTEALEPYWAWLWLGQWIHVGKGAVMGMGGYDINGGGNGLGKSLTLSTIRAIFEGKRQLFQGL